MEAKKVTHIRNYVKIQKTIVKHYDNLRSEYEKSLAKAREGLERVRRGEKDPSDHRTEKDYENLVRRFEAELRPPYRGKPRKDTVLWWRQRALDRLDAADGAPKFTGLKVRIEWKRSRTWGSNPSAECWVFGDGPAIYPVNGEDGKTLSDHNGPVMTATHHSTGHASGCGYDKCSAAVEDGILCPTIDRLIIENEKTWRFYAVEGKDYFPHLSIGGKGVETLRGLFKAYGEKPPIPGFEWQWEEGRTWDYLEVRPKAKRKR